MADWIKMYSATYFSVIFIAATVFLILYYNHVVIVQYNPVGPHAVIQSSRINLAIKWLFLEK